VTCITLARRAAVVLSLVGTQALSACVSLHAPAFTMPSSERAWPNALATARARAGESKFDAADSVLVEFATRYPNTPEALETAYWRAVLKIDPSNSHASFAGAIALLDAYLADPRLRPHVVEAQSLRRVAAHLEGLNKLAASAMAQAKDASSTAANAKAQAADANARADAAKSEPPPSAEVEIKRLKDELAKANAELDRIRKRLSQPPPKPRELREPRGSL
jgi:hypothetical protein